MNAEQVKFQLGEIMKFQAENLNGLLSFLEEQHGYIVKNDVFKMEAVVEKIQECNQQVANIELKRRQMTKDLLGDRTFGKFVEELDDEELYEKLREIRKILEAIRLQKDTNELLLKQSISFTNRMLIMMNPDRQAKTYNGYGKMKR